MSKQIKWRDVKKFFYDGHVYDGGITTLKKWNTQQKEKAMKRGGIFLLLYKIKGEARIDIWNDTFVQLFHLHRTRFQSIYWWLPGICVAAILIGAFFILKMR